MRLCAKNTPTGCPIQPSRVPTQALFDMVQIPERIAQTIGGIALWCLAIQIPTLIWSSALLFVYLTVVWIP